MVMGFVAGLEAVLMLLWARIGRSKSQISIFFVASVLYAIYLVWLAFLTTRWKIYAASAIGGIGTALFAIGTSVAGYGTVSIMGAMAGLASVAILAKVEYNKN
ncbi:MULTISPECIES: hypothetical protein [Ochrobactrum]|uniref:QacE family quaternary ammonium compound efflux SMR transporter n=1 Tax=Ochrobactrum chromiisoli TaxID=2993941 RepID=A0ABT3QRJ2_9HYPH|nr:hypothetical protein [Ochrobactrum chromiisoli]MCX2698246.1 hypothetical protein [Ochrobactrum chromiisoli]